MLATPADPTLQDRAELPVTADAVSSLIDFVSESMPHVQWTEYACDLRRKLGDIGRDELNRWAWLVEDEVLHDGLNEWVRETWKKCNRPFNPRTDSLLVDLMRDARERGWLTPLHFGTMIEAGALAEDTRRAERLAPNIDAMIRAAVAAEKARQAERRAALQADTDPISTAIRSGRIPLPTGYATAPSGSMPLANTQAVIADLGRPFIEAFLVAQSGRPAAYAPTLPDAMREHPLFEPLNAALAHVIGLAEQSPKTFRAAAALDTLAVLSAVHQPTFETVCARIRAAGAVLPESKLTAAVRRFEAQVSREVRTGTGWALDAKGFPDAGNTDNVAVFMRTIGAELRFNAWSQRAEIRWSNDGPWSPLQEHDFNSLLTTAGNGQFNFRPRESLLKRSLAALAHETKYDPVLERLAAAQSEWDGVPRLNTWLTRACGTPCDPYHQAVGRNLIGGICKRARRPGCKHDEVVIFIGEQDTLKSTLCRLLALSDEWFSDSVDFSGSAQNVVPQLFGRLVVELAELDGMARREVQFIKRFLSTQSDSVTLKYSTFTSDHARRCIFIGTSNEDTPLRDTTGNRRFLPVRIERRIDVEWVQANLDQIVGEAATLESAGELFLIPADILPEARARQEEARAEADFETYLHAWFDRPGIAYVAAADLTTLLKDATGRSIPANQYSVAMRRLGFVRLTARVNGTPARVWCRGNMEEGAQRYIMHRGPDGRFSPILPPTAAGAGNIYPLVRP